MRNPVRRAMARLAAMTARPRFPARRAAAALLALLALAALACRKEFAGRAIEPARPAPDVGALRMADQRGKVVVLTFGFTYCPDVCPRTLSQLKAAYAALGDDSPRVAMAFVTVDPERDPPEELRAYVDRFDRRIVPVFVEPPALKATLDGYGVTATRRYAGGASSTAAPATDSYTVDHTAGIFLVDKQGRLRLFHRHDGSVDALVADVRRLLAEPDPPAARAAAPPVTADR